MKQRVFFLILLYAGVLGHAATADWRAPPVFSVAGPTIVAFFPLTDAELKSDDTNEALGDFQYYVGQVEKPLQRRGIKLYQSYAASFQLKLETGTEAFTPKDRGCGYYFVAPGQKPHIEYGVMTGDDLLHEARKYLNH
jgi:hypothetical protein